MPLTCYCDWEGDIDTIWFEPPDDYSKLNTKRRKRCSSCGDLIDVGAIVIEWRRWRHPQDDVQLNIYAEDAELDLAPAYNCERCADLYWSLQDLGFECVLGDEDMVELVKEYAETYGKAA